MLHRLRPTPARFASAVLAAGALLTACSPNPADWVEARWEPLAVLTQRCPNLEGTFALRSGNRSPLSQTVFASYVRSSAPRFPWETVTLAGDTDWRCEAKGAALATVNWITLGFDSWGGPPLTIWIDGLGLR